MSVITGEKEYFKGIGQIKYEGPETGNPLAYRWYDAGKTVAGKTMKQWGRSLRRAHAYPSLE
jgi:xylose isomerase